VRPLSIPVDLIRTVAIVGVILLHAANDLTIQQMNTLEIFRWTTVDIYQSLGRMGVPLFVMLTGALLLQPSKQNESLSVFFKKRWARIGLPFAFWVTIYFAWDFTVEHQAFTANAVINGLLNGPYYQFWYLYMLAGLYLLTPILRILVTQGSTAILRYLVILWFVGASLIPFVSFFTKYTLQSDVFLLTGFIGYFILGTYLLHLHDGLEHRRKRNILLPTLPKPNPNLLLRNAVSDFNHIPATREHKQRKRQLQKSQPL
jgi:surface polysaccharide O-acyltransferase-like enzyme